MDENQPDSSDLRHVTLLTLAHYEVRAESFRAGTRDHDVRHNIDAILSRITAPSPFTLLDFGCGPGRDLKTFCGLGHVAIGLDGAAAFVAMARADTGCEVWQQDFLALDLPVARFDGVFANASLFHVPMTALPRVLRQLHATLKPGGVLFSSNPRGNNEAGWNGDRYGVYHDLDAWRGFMTAANFEELLVYYRPDDCRAIGSRGWRPYGGHSTRALAAASRGLDQHTGLRARRARAARFRRCDPVALVGHR